MPIERPERQPDQTPRRETTSPARDDRTGKSAAAARINNQHQWVDQQIRVAMERGDFDDLPGAGKPLESIGSEHDPDWWVKKLIEREQITGVLPEALQLRKDDAELADSLDRLAREDDVRDTVEAFNRRVVGARRQLQGGPPVVTSTRDVEAEVDAWRTRRRAARRSQLSRDSAERAEQSDQRRRRSLLRPLFRRGERGAG